VYLSFGYFLGEGPLSSSRPGTTITTISSGGDIPEEQTKYWVDLSGCGGGTIRDWSRSNRREFFDWIELEDNGNPLSSRECITVVRLQFAFDDGVACTVDERSNGDSSGRPPSLPQSKFLLPIANFGIKLDC